MQEKRIIIYEIYKKVWKTFTVWWHHKHFHLKSKRTKRWWSSTWVSMSVKINGNSGRSIWIRSVNSKRYQRILCISIYHHQLMCLWSEIYFRGVLFKYLTPMCLTQKQMLQQMTFTSWRCLKLQKNCCTKCFTQKPKIFSANHSSRIFTTICQNVTPHLLSYLHKSILPAKSTSSKVIRKI